jgi:hypothetical protein
MNSTASMEAMSSWTRPNCGIRLRAASRQWDQGSRCR